MPTELKLTLNRVQVTRGADGPDQIIVWFIGKDGREYDFDQAVPRGGASEYLRGLGVASYSLRSIGSISMPSGRKRPTDELTEVTL